MPATIKSKYKLFEVVFMVHDPDQYEWMVIDIRYNGVVRYLVRSAGEEYECLEDELSTEKLIK